MIDSWGWATWIRGWDLFGPDGQKILDKIKTKKLDNVFDFKASFPFIEMLGGTIARHWAFILNSGSHCFGCKYAIFFSKLLRAKASGIQITV